MRPRSVQLPNVRRVLAYARVSSSDQALGTSLQDQQDAITAYAKARGMSVAHFYVEAKSAVREKIEHREQMRALMNDVRPGDLVLCDKLDRWSRDAEFSYSSIRQILERGAGFFAVGDQVDPSTPEGDTALSFRILFAREEHKRIKQRLVGTRRLLRDRGYYVEGLPALGYRRSQPKGFRGAVKNVLVIEASEAATVVRAFQLCVKGKPLQAIAAELGLTRDRVHETIHNRVYLGEIRDTRGQWMRGLHPAIVDADLFQRANDALTGRRFTGAAHRHGIVETSDWILRDVARCGRCEAKMTSAYAGPQSARRYYYRCFAHCTSRYLRVPVVEAQGATLVQARLIELREVIARGPEVRRIVPVVDYAGQVAKVNARRARLVQGFEAGLISLGEFRERSGRCDEDRTKVEAAQLAAGRPDVLADAAVQRALLKEVRSVERVWQLANGVGRRQIVNLLASAFALEADHDPRPVWRTPSELAAEVSP